MILNKADILIAIDTFDQVNTGQISRLKDLGLSVRLNETGRILDYENVVDDLTVEVIQSASKKYLNTANYVKVILYPEEVE